MKLKMHSRKKNLERCLALENNSGIQVSFTSIGSGFFPVHYAFCMKIPEAVILSSTIKLDKAEGNLVLKFGIECSTSLHEYYVGLTQDSLKKEFFSELENIENIINTKEENGTDKTEDLSLIERVDKENNSLTVIFSQPSQNSENIENKISSCSESNDSYNKVECDNVYSNEESTKEKEKHSPVVRGNLKKSRTHSECGFQIPTEIERRSILKCSRSLSESNVDDYSAWSSVDSSDSCVPEEISNGNKKTVRFSDVISEKVFRANSSILGQRKKNQRKARNKKKAHERRASESCEEASGSEAEIYDSSACEESSVSETSEASSEEESNVNKLELIPSSKTHRRRGSKNKRKNAATAKHNNIFCTEE